MRRKNIRSKLEYDIPEEFTNYASWHYVNDRPRYDPSLYQILRDTMGQSFCQSHRYGSDSPVKNFFHYIKYNTPEFYVLSQKFSEWMKENTWINEYYNFCFSKAAYVSDPFNTDSNHWVNFGEDCEKTNRVKKYLSEGEVDFKKFHILCLSSDHLLMFNEIKRDIPFVIGNVVKLRSGFINSRHHDPFLRNRDLKNEERVGHITAILDDTHSNSFNGRGSRLVKVHWYASGEEVKQSVSSLKLFDQKNNKMIDKIRDE